MKRAAGSTSLALLAVSVTVVLNGCARKGGGHRNESRFAPTVPAGIPPAALLYRRQIIREVHYFWGMDQKASEFFAQIHQESHFNKNAQSTYAFGLAQFTP